MYLLLAALGIELQGSHMLLMVSTSNISSLCSDMIF